MGNREWGKEGGGLPVRRSWGIEGRKGRKRESEGNGWVRRNVYLI